MATLLYGCMSKVPGPFRLTSQRSSAYEYRDVIHKVSNRRAKTVLSNTVLVIEHYTVHGCSLPQPEVRWEAPERITVIDITAIPRQLLLGHVSVGICTGLPCGCLSLAVVEGYPGVEVGGERGPRNHSPNHFPVREGGLAATKSPFQLAQSLCRHWSRSDIHQASSE
jgi:hypothetical protein